MTQKIQIGSVRHCYIVYNNSSAYGYKRVWLSKKCEVKPTFGKLEYSGDGMKLQKMYGYQLDGTIEADATDDTLDSILFVTPVVTPVGGDLFAKRYVKGTRAELQTNYVGVWITMDGEDADTGAVLAVRYNILKAQFNPETPPALATEAVAGRMLSFNARKTTVDILGNAVTGVPSDGAFWTYDIITNAANFDPVAEVY